MPREEVFNLHPKWWENDPEEERFKLSTLDYLAALTYNNYVLFFKLPDIDKLRAVTLLKAGLERTLSQARHYCGTIERDPSGGHSFVKKRDSTVRLVVQWLDGADDARDYPSMDDLSAANFSSAALGELRRWCVDPMTYGEKPEAHPDASPAVAAFKANFVRGGLVFTMHHHHFANDVMGWVGFTHQLAENCRAVAEGTDFPPWDPACLDLSRLTKPEPSEEIKVDGPPAQEKHPDHTAGVSLFFHLPRSKAAELKALATPSDGSWVSTYDAFCAFIWRTITRLRAPVFNKEGSSHLLWVHAVDMRRRFHSPTIPTRTQRNAMTAVFSNRSAVPQPTVAQVISEWALPELASWVRRLTQSVDQDVLDQMLSVVAAVRDKSALNVRVDANPPMSVLVTDHRDADMAGVEFGFGAPVAYRHPFEKVTAGLVMVYPPRSSGGPDEGVEFSIAYEKRLAEDLIKDEEFGRFFEYRGIDAEDA